MMIILAKFCGIFMVTYWGVLGVLLYYTRDQFLRKNFFISYFSGVNESMKVIEQEANETKNENQKRKCVDM